MTKEYNSIGVVGSGGGFRSEAIVSETIASGQTGELISLPAVDGKFYKIFLLVAASGNQGGITLTCDGEDLFSEKSLTYSTSISTSATHTAIVRAFSSSNAGLVRNLYQEVLCESFSLHKNTGNTLQDIYLSYEIGNFD